MWEEGRKGEQRGRNREGEEKERVLARVKVEGGKSARVNVGRSNVRNSGRRRRKVYSAVYFMVLQTFKTASTKLL